METGCSRGLNRHPTSEFDTHATTYVAHLEVDILRVGGSGHGIFGLADQCFVGIVAGKLQSGCTHWGGDFGQSTVVQHEDILARVETDTTHGGELTVFQRAGALCFEGVGGEGAFEHEHRVGVVV